MSEDVRGFLVPNGLRVIVEEDNFKYTGRLVIPDTAKRRPTTGHIVAVGPTVDQEWLSKRIVYGAFSGTLITFKNRPAYRVLGVEEILAEVTVEDTELEDTSA